MLLGYFTFSVIMESAYYYSLVFKIMFHTQFDSYIQ